MACNDSDDVEEERLSLPFYQVDAFSAGPFGGNPAAVVLIPHGCSIVDDDVRQRIAAENNLAETAFVELEEPHLMELFGEGTINGRDDLFAKASHFVLRWFTPTTEVPLCGHATLAAAAALIKERKNKHATLYFHTVSSGVLEVTRGLAMSLPWSDPVDAPPACVGGEQGALARACCGSLPVRQVLYAGASAGGLNYVLMVLAEGTTREQLEGIQPYFGAMAESASKADGVHGVIVTCAGGTSGHDFLSRFFGPWLGVPEDHVTGSAHAVLGPYWTRRLGKTELRARQCSARGGELGVHADEAGRRVVVSGDATVVIRGTMVV